MILTQIMQFKKKTSGLGSTKYVHYIGSTELHCLTLNRYVGQRGREGKGVVFTAILIA